MDGRLLDFNGLYSLFPSEHPYDFEYRLKLAQMMSEPALLLQGTSDLCLYLGKYLFSPSFTSFAQQQVEACFHHTFQKACYRDYLAILGIPVHILVSKETPEILERLVDSFMKLFSRRKGTLYCAPNVDRAESPLEQLVVTLIRCSQGHLVPEFDTLENDLYFMETRGILAEANRWIIETCCVQGLDASKILNGMETQARQRLQSRACLDKVRMLREITDLLDTHRGDHLHLQQALSAMEAKTLAFAKEAFGCQHLTNHLLEGREKA